MHMNEEADKQIDEMLKKDVIQKSTSLWASGIVMVTKKDGPKRFCIDYRKLNDITVKDAKNRFSLRSVVRGRIVFLP